jgi:hypothetical protein
MPRPAKPKLREKCERRRVDRISEKAHDRRARVLARWASSSSVQACAGSASIAASALAVPLVRGPRPSRVVRGSRDGRRLSRRRGALLAVNTLRLCHAAIRYLHLLAGYRHRPPRPRCRPPSAVSNASTAGRPIKDPSGALPVAPSHPGDPGDSPRAERPGLAARRVCRGAVAERDREARARGLARPAAISEGPLFRLPPPPIRRGTRGKPVADRYRICDNPMDYAQSLEAYRCNFCRLIPNMSGEQIIEEYE